MTRSASRRQFLQTSAAAAAAASVPYFAWASPLIAQDAKTESKNDRPHSGLHRHGRPLERASARRR